MISIEVAQFSRSLAGFSQANQMAPQENRGSTRAAKSWLISGLCILIVAKVVPNNWDQVRKLAT